MAIHGNIDYTLDRVGPCLKYNILYMNINSLLNKLNDLEVVIEEHKGNGNLIHFIALTEVRLDDQSSEYYNIDDYTAFYCNKQRNSGGVALFCHNTMSCAPLFQMNVCGVDVLGISVFNLNIKIAVIYKQPTVLFSQMLPILECLLEKYHRCVMVGDMNIDLLRNNADTIRFSNTIEANGYCILNKIDINAATRSATRDGSTTNTIIDHVLTDLSSFNFHLSVLPTPLSDHNQLILSFDTHSSSITPSPPIFFVTNKADFNKFRSLILNNPYLNDSFAHNANIDNCLEFMKSQFQSCITKKHRAIHNEKKPWITPYLLSLISQRDRYHLLLKKHPNNNYIRDNFKQFKSAAEYNRKNSRNRYFSNLIQKNIGNAKKLWEVFNHIIYNRKNALTKTISIKDQNGHALTNDLAIANELNNYFTNVGPSLAMNLQSLQNRPISPTLNRSISNSMVIRAFDRKDIVSCVNDLKSTSAINIEIPSAIIKRNIDILTPILLQLINSSFDNGYFPDALKIARLVPIFKADDPTIPSNYRPISILPSISKIFERLLYKVTQAFIFKFNVINKLQFGFQKGSGSLSATSYLITYLQSALDDPKRKIAASIFIDLQKAFDSIPHKILIDKLYKYGIRGSPLNIFKSYLANRKQFTNINNTNSTMRNITYGTPQGSNLGPLLFLLYINDIFELPLKGNLILFADDAVLSYSGHNIMDIYSNMQYDLNLLVDWLYDNVLTINISKTKYMIFHSESKHIDMNGLKIQINDTEIERVTTIKYLGLHLQCNLKWNTHASVLTKKIAPLAGVLYKLSRCTPEHLLRSIYFAHIHSKLSYLSPVWGSAAPQYIIDELQIIQNKAIRNIFYHDYHVSHLHTNEILKKYKILNVRQLVEYDTTIFFYKIKNNLIKTDFNITRNSDIHNYPTRNRSNIRVTRYNTNYGMFNVYYSGARLYNLLNEQLRDTPTLSAFKRLLRAHIVNTDNQL